MSSKPNKRPAILFFINDWLGDPGVRRCSLEARGLWIDMLAYMHQGDPYGHLRFAAKDILPGVLPGVLARMVGTDEMTVERLLTELEDAGVFSRTDQGTIYSRRMVRDEQIRRERAEGGKESQKNPNVPRRKADTQKAEGYPSIHPSADPSTYPSPHPPGGPCLEDEDVGVSSSSSCASKIKDTQSINGSLNGTRVGPDVRELFETEFWKPYPSRDGYKKEKAAALKLFVKLSAEEQRLCCQAVRNYAESGDVKKGIGIRDPPRFLVRGCGKEKEELWRTFVERKSVGVVLPADSMRVCGWTISNGRHPKTCGKSVSGSESHCDEHLPLYRVERDHIAKLQESVIR